MQKNSREGKLYVIVADVDASDELRHASGGFVERVRAGSGSISYTAGATGLHLCCQATT